MAREPSCPICDSDLALAGDEQAGDEVFCSYCKSPVIIRARGGDAADGADGADWEVEADF